jgi:hypothetical protein
MHTYIMVVTTTSVAPDLEELLLEIVGNVNVQMMPQRYG